MKRKKMNLYDMESAGIIYFNCTRIKDSKGYKGYAYMLNKPLTSKQKETINGFENTVITSVTYRYAPEIKHDVVVLYDRIAKAGESA